MKKQWTVINRFIFAFLALAIGFSLLPAKSFAATALVNKTVEYGTTTKFEGYFVSPKNAKKNTPGILMIHNWKGVTAETKKQADRFASLGYHVFAADIYGKGIRPTEAKDAGAQATIYKTDRKLFRERILLGMDELVKLQGNDQVVVAGYCFGGTAAIEAARSGAKILAAISFHGGLDSPIPADGKNIKGKVLALHGAIDPYETAADLVAFEKEMQDSNVDYQLVKYGGAVHSFTELGAGTDITKGAAYNEAADRRSFAAADDFLKEVFAKTK